MMRIYLFLLFYLSLQGAYGQDGRRAFSSPYETTWVDGVISAGGIGLSYWGIRLMQDKDGVGEAEIQRINANLKAAKAEIPAIDRWAAGKYSEQADKLSNIPFYTSFGLPLLFLADERTRSHALQIGLLYLETMAITGALFTQTNARVERNRPNVYNLGAGEEVRMDDKSKNAFYGGHTVATASATFFVAKVFNDFFPNSPAKPYVWTGAAVVPAFVGYLRLEAGKHFLTDNLIGYALGAGAGILVPHLHKQNRHLSLSPGRDIYGNNTIRLRYRF